MHRMLVFVVFVALSLSVPPASAAGPCEFKLGFKALGDQISGVVGDCVENEKWNTTNGDSLQQTTKGLLVWRKADNFTAFTDGYRTWVRGPYGVQQRLNTEQFEWEARPGTAVTGASPARPAPAKNCGPADVIVAIKSKFNDDGRISFTGTVTNSCDRPMNVQIDVLDTQGENGPPMAAGPTVNVIDVPAKGTKQFGSNYIGSPFSDWYLVQKTLIPVSSDPKTCWSEGPNCILVDNWLLSTLRKVNEWPEGSEMLGQAAAFEVVIDRRRLDPGVLGSYRPSTRTITIDERLDSYSSWVRAAVVVHELQHALDHAAGRLSNSVSGCVINEEDAFRRQARFWTSFWRAGLPEDFDSPHAELNSISRQAFRDPVGLARRLARTYHSQCD